MQGRSLILLALAASIVAICSAADAAKEWNYIRTDAEAGPSSWSKNFAACAGVKNSPIDLPTDKMKLYGKKVQSWDLQNWDKANKWTVLDDNYTVKFSLEGSDVMKTVGGGLGSDFEVIQFHLHWAEDSTKGSEHTLNTKMYPMEVHFVHKNAEFPTITDAINAGNSDSLAAVGFFFEIQDTDNAALTSLIDGIKAVRDDAGYSVADFTVNVNDFVATPFNGSYYRYFGGLTTPGCQEIVEWTVFETPIGISEAQMAIVRNQTVFPKGKDFYRDVQPLGSRELIKYDVNYDAKDYPTTPPPTTTTTTTTTTDKTSGATHVTAAAVSTILLANLITRFL